jgi:uncharacterized protein (DUF433 family)
VHVTGEIVHFYLYTKGKIIIMQEEVRIHPYVIRDERISGGSAVIRGTRTQQIHDALSYYYENREEIDRKIKDEQEFVKRLS